MNLPIVRYFEKDVLINNERIRGVQDISFDNSASFTNVNIYGSILKPSSIYENPTDCSVSIDRLITEEYGSMLGPINLQEHCSKWPLDNYSIERIIHDGQSTSYKVKNAVLTSGRFSFDSDGVFSESWNFIGKALDPSSLGQENVGVARNNRLTHYKRQHYVNGSVPLELGANIHLRSVEVTFDINHTEIATFESFRDSETKMVSFPIDINCTYTCYLNESLGWNLPNYYSNSKLLDTIQYQPIKIIAKNFSIDLGDKNYLSTIDISGGSTEGNNYDILRMTYTNTNNYFVLSYGDSNNIIDGNLEFLLDANLLNEFIIIDGNK